MTTTAILTRLSATTAVVLSLFAFSSVARAATPQLLAKYNFEGIPAYVPDWGAGLGSTYKPATGWKTPFKVSLDADNPHAGDKSLRFQLLEDSPKEKIVHGPAIKLEAPAADHAGDRKISIHLYVRATGLADKAAGIRILERDEKNASIRLLNNAKILAPIVNSADWVEVSATGTLHSRTRSITFMLVVNQEQSPLTVWIDDVSVELASAD